MHDGYVRISQDADGKRIDHTVLQRGNEVIHRQRVEAHLAPISVDAGGRLRTGSLTTWFDGKVVRGEDTAIWDTKGTGTATPQDGGVLLSVSPGQYLVRQSRTFQPYLSGKSQLTEMTFDRFAPQPGVIKRYGYFSSNAVAPFASNLDGWFVESNGDTGLVSLVVSNNGTEKLRMPWEEWENFDSLEGMDWDKFTVCLVDFLWLGGAVLHANFKKPSDDGFVQAHCYNYAGSDRGPFMRSPHQPVRYEIRSTGGSGSFNSICSQVATEGALNGTGKARVVYHTNLLSCNSVGTIYAIKAVKKRAEYRDVPLKLEHFGGVTTGVGDAGMFMLLRNPTLSAPLVYSQSGPIDEATATNQTVTNVGRVIETIHVVQSGQIEPVTDNVLSWLSSSIDNVMDEFVLAYMPLTATQNVNGTIHLLEY